MITLITVSGNTHQRVLKPVGKKRWDFYIVSKYSPLPRYASPQWPQKVLSVQRISKSSLHLIFNSAQ